MKDLRFIFVCVVLVAAGFSSPGRADYAFVTQFGSTGTSRGQFFEPRGITVDNAGRIIVTDSGNDRIQVCNEAGTCNDFGAFGSLSGEFDKPRDVAANSVDRLFIADRGNDRIASCANTGSCTDFGGSGVVVGKFESPRGIDIDSQDQIYITDTDNNRVQICNDQGVCSAFGSLGTALGQFSSPSGIAVNSQGMLAIADRGNDRIQVCTAMGSCTAFGSFGTATGSFNYPAGVAVNSRDEIIIADRFNHRIQVCSSQGTCSSFGSLGVQPGQFDSPWGVAVDDNDRILVVDSGNDRIQIFAPTSAPPVEITSFTASPDALLEGESVTLSWSVNNATACTPLDGTASWRSQDLNSSGGSVQVIMASAGSFTFTLQCTDGSNAVSASASVSVSAAPILTEMNVGLNDAWFNPVTNGQGFFITVFPDIGYVSLSWFTYDTERPGAGVTANLGEPGHRWLNALGAFSGNQAVMDISFATGGLFDTATEISEVSDGTMTLTFDDCESGTVEYSIPSIGQQGTVPIQRVVSDNIAFCEALAEQVALERAGKITRVDSSTVSSFYDPFSATQAVPVTTMNVGLNDAWFNPVTNGQGFFITVFPDIAYVSLSWFTYDTERPAAGVIANIGEPGHRWLNALGAFSGNQAVLDISFATGGIFDTATEISEVSDGTMILTFADCESGTVEYNIPSIGRQGTVPIQRVVSDNIALCEAFEQ
jgi:DNA-binding beta-propeller fold protein YncE